MRHAARRPAFDRFVGRSDALGALGAAALATLALGSSAGAAAGELATALPPNKSAATVSAPAPAADLVVRAEEARAAYASHILAPRYTVLIDYRLASSAPRFFIEDGETGDRTALLVAHGRGSDPDHDGVADQFSDVPDSKMSSLGAFVTGVTYVGAHGLSLRLHGLESTNANAFDRAIVVHGAAYVAPDRAVLGRSWGCPALEQAEATRWIPRLAGGALVVAVG